MTTAKDKLTKRKRTVAERLINPGEMTLAQLCEAEQITVAELCRYFEEQPFTAYLHRLIEGYSEGSLAAVWDALIDKCRDGDVRAIKLYFELKGGLKASKDGGAAVIITGADDLE